MTQREVDKLITQSVTNTIDAYNTITSPYIVTLFKKVKGNNWLIDQTELGDEKYYTYTKQLLPDTDTLKLRIDPISQLKYKYITDFTINFNTEISNYNAKPKISNVTAIVFDNEYPLEVNEYIEESNTIECGLFDMDLDDTVIYDAIQASEFWIELNFNGNGSNCKLVINNFNVEIGFSDDLEIERNAIYNRLEDLFDDIDLNLDDLNRTIHPENYPVISLISDTYEKFKTKKFIGVISIDDVVMANQSIDYYINDIYKGTSISDINGQFDINVEDMNDDFNIKCIFKGNSLFESTSLNQNIIVNKYTPDLTLIFQKTNFSYVETPPQKEPINFNCELDLIEGYPVKIECYLKDNSGTILNSLTFNEVNNDFNITFTDYNVNATNILVKVIGNENYNDVEKTQNITITKTSSITYITPKITLVSSHNNYSDNLHFRVKNGTTNLTAGTCTITVNGKTKTVSNSNGTFSIPLTTTYGVSNLTSDKSYSYKIVYNGYTSGSTIYNSVSLSGNVTVEAPRTKSVYFNNYAGTPSNTNDGSYRKWYTLNSGSYHQCICGNADYTIASSSGTHNTPRCLKAYNVTTGLSGITVTGFTVTYYDSNYPYKDSLSTSNSCNVGKSNSQCKVTLKGTTYTFTDKVTVGNKSWSKHSFSKSGLKVTSDYNSISMVLCWGKNTNGNPGRLKVQSCQVKYTFRYNQTISN